jgi:hypothetical protein
VFDSLSTRTVDAWIRFAGNVDWQAPTTWDWQRFAAFVVAVCETGDTVEVWNLLRDAECPNDSTATFLSRFVLAVAMPDAHANASALKDRSAPQPVGHPAQRFAF